MRVTTVGRVSGQLRAGGAKEREREHAVKLGEGQNPISKLDYHILTSSSSRVCLCGNSPPPPPLSSPLSLPPFWTLVKCGLWGQWLTTQHHIISSLKSRRTGKTFSRAVEFFPLSHHLLPPPLHPPKLLQRASTGQRRGGGGKFVRKKRRKKDLTVSERGQGLSVSFSRSSFYAKLFFFRWTYRCHPWPWWGCIRNVQRGMGGGDGRVLSFHCPATPAF